MKHILEIQEDRLEELQAAIQKINPEASIAIGAGMDPVRVGRAHSPRAMMRQRREKPSEEGRVRRPRGDGGLLTSGKEERNGSNVPGDGGRDPQEDG